MSNEDESEKTSINVDASSWNFWLLLAIFLFVASIIDAATQGLLNLLAGAFQ